jgi:hypothetical protein
MSSRRWAREDGQALVLALGMIVVTLLIGFATLAYAMEANTLTSHDQRLRRAQQGADAGIQQALYTNADVTDDGYNFTGGTLGLSALLDQRRGRQLRGVSQRVRQRECRGVRAAESAHLAGGGQRGLLPVRVPAQRGGTRGLQRQRRQL